MSETYGLLVHKPPQFQNTPTRRGICSFETKSSLFIDRDPHWYTRRVKEAIHRRLHPNNINRDSGIEIPEAWIPTIRKHNSQSVRIRTYQGTASQSRNNNEDRNAPIAANQGTTNSDTQQLTLSKRRDLHLKSDSIVRKTGRFGRTAQFDCRRRQTNHFFADISIFESGGVTKHLMTGPSANSEPCFPSTLNIESLWETKLTVSLGARQ